MKKNNGYQIIHKRIPYSTTNIDHQNILAIIKNTDDFEKDINKKMALFEKEGINISACSNYFENMVDKYIAQLLNKLETEHAKNMNSIGYLFRKRASDKNEFQEFLDRLDMEIVTTEVEYDKLKKIAEEMNPLKNGRLEAEQDIDSQEED
ncbi:hypothetical protein AALB47_20985 [Lachnospiraceae bacterium 54-11]